MTVPAWAVSEPEGCTGVSARWCPIHGDCACPEPDPDRTVDQPPMNSYGCPLHGDKSHHADGLADDEPAAASPGTPEADAPIDVRAILIDRVWSAFQEAQLDCWKSGGHCMGDCCDKEGLSAALAIAVGDARPLIEADLIRRSEEAEDEAIAEMLAGSDFLGMAPNGEGGIDLRVKVAAKLAAGLVDAAKGILEVHSDARNYLEQEVIDRATGDRYVIIFCRPGGKTPHELRRKAEGEADRLRDQVADLEDELAIARSDAGTQP